MTVDLNPARLARFADWATTLPLHPLPRTVTPVPGEYYLGYIGRLAEANHLEFGELADALNDTAAITLHGPCGWKQHEQQRLAAAAGQPLARIARLCWPDASVYLRDIEGFHQMLRPACRRCTARRGITEPVACYLPPHQTICAATGSGPAQPPAATQASSTSASSPRSFTRSAATSPWCTSTTGGTWKLPSARPPAPSTTPSAAAPGSRARGSACTSSPPAPGNKPWPACSPPAPAGQTTGPAIPSSRSRSTPTSSGSPRAASGRKTPAAVQHREAPSRP